MEDPVVCTVSGNSYERSAIRKHIAGCYEKGEDPYEPLTREIIERPNKDIIPNRTLLDTINEWKQSGGRSDEDLREKLRLANIALEADSKTVEAFEEERRKWGDEKRRWEEEKRKREELEAKLKAYEDQSKSSSTGPEEKKAEPKSKSGVTSQTKMPSESKSNKNRHQCITALQGHTNSVCCLIEHNNKLYSGSGDKTIRAWSLDTNECITALQGHTNWVMWPIVHNNILYSGSMINHPCVESRHI